MGWRRRPTKPPELEASAEVGGNLDNLSGWPYGHHELVHHVGIPDSCIQLLQGAEQSGRAPALLVIADDLHMNPVESQMALSVYVLAIAFGPLVLGPLSELYGRSIIIHSCNVWFLAWSFACTFASTKGLLIAARFLAGFGASLVYAVSNSSSSMKSITKRFLDRYGSPRGLLAS